MARLQTVASVATAEGLLELKQRQEREFIITIAGRVLMNSVQCRSEQALSTLACAAISGRRAPRVLVGGLGMGITLRQALDRVPADAEVVVVELNPVISEWCAGPLATLNQHALADARVRLVNGDVNAYIAKASQNRAEPRFDAVLLDLYEGPHSATQEEDDPCWGVTALRAAMNALGPKGVLAVWSEQADPKFEARLQKIGFSCEIHRPGRGGLRHVIYLARR
jgi:spermidine synthase